MCVFRVYPSDCGNRYRTGSRSSAANSRAEKKQEKQQLKRTRTRLRGDLRPNFHHAVQSRTRVRDHVPDWTA